MRTVKQIQKHFFFFFLEYLWEEGSYICKCSVLLEPSVMNPHRDPLNDENAISQPKCGTHVLHPVCNVHLSPVKTGQRHALEVQVYLRSLRQGSLCDRNTHPPRINSVSFTFGKLSFCPPF